MKQKLKAKGIGLLVILIMIPSLTGCELIDMALTDMGIVKDENGGRRAITQQEVDQLNNQKGDEEIKISEVAGK